MKKKRVEIVIELDEGDSKKYKIEIIRNNMVFFSKLADHLLGIYYLVL